MSKNPADYNVTGGLNGLGTNLLLSIVREMTSIRDVQNFLGVSKATASIVSHERFQHSTEPALRDRTGTKALVCRRLPNMAAVISPTLTEEQKAKIDMTIFDVTKESHPCTEACRIKSMTVQYRNVRIDDNNSFFSFQVIYVDGLGTLRKALIDFDDLDYPGLNKRELAQKWHNECELPPTTEKFVKVKTGGHFTWALSEKGQIWQRGWNQQGTYDESEKWVICERFGAADGLVNSSLGKSRIKNFHFDVIHGIIILENGAVFAFGSIQEFQGYGDVPADGCVELTDSTKFKPRFYEPLSGSMNRDAGQYGIFGTYKPDRYWRRMNAFTTAEGEVLMRTVQAVDGKKQFYYSGLDTQKFFGEKRIVNMNHHMDEVFMFESGNFAVIKGKRHVEETLEDLGKIKARRKLEIPVERLKCSILTKHTHTTMLYDDGRLMSYNLEDGGGKVTDVTGYATELSKDDKNPNGMVIKWYRHDALSYHFLYE